jgi:hypothetical protein
MSERIIKLTNRTNGDIAHAAQRTIVITISLLFPIPLGLSTQGQVVAMVAANSGNSGFPPQMESSEWSELLLQLPLFPPAAHPPSTLYPLLAPLLRQKTGLLSLGRGRNWPSALTWLPPELSYKVNERLKNLQPSILLEEHFRGYRRFDDETVCAYPRT